mmetsp:Transcript_22010/g.87366  ORF Transcript_22010/g.87366 Transcript_22010/m.87366 type:complete len:92 (+) Transcript_22010:150-425(+)
MHRAQQCEPVDEAGTGSACSPALHRTNTAGRIDGRQGRALGTDNKTQKNIGRTVIGHRALAGGPASCRSRQTSLRDSKTTPPPPAAMTTWS